jgi:hypothetical protein
MPIGRVHRRNAAHPGKGDPRRRGLSHRPGIDPSFVRRHRQSIVFCEAAGRWCRGDVVGAKAVQRVIGCPIAGNQLPGAVHPRRPAAPGRLTSTWFSNPKTSILCGLPRIGRCAWNALSIPHTSIWCCFRAAACTCFRQHLVLSRVLHEEEDQVFTRWYVDRLDGSRQIDPVIEIHF